ncbi:MAG: hypothetical protein M3R13_04915 [Armatimonadota bacterium]|nr:hypothetical protein [Armatimonadota bacterium]
MRTSISRLKPAAAFACLYLLALAIVIWLVSDELPFLHPGKVHVYVDFDEEVTNATIGSHVLDTDDTSDTVWLEPGSYEVKFEIADIVHTKSINVTNETYIGLDGDSPYVHGDD